jgi:hypothetical protein
MTGSPIPPGQMPDYLYAPVFGSLYIYISGDSSTSMFAYGFFPQNGQDEL